MIRKLVHGMCLLAISLAGTAAASAQEVVRARAQYLARADAVRHALMYNPSLMTVRQQHGFADAAIVSAATYPYNPVFTGNFAGVGGRVGAHITNRAYLEDFVTLELEVRGQGRLRRAGANAARARIEAEITQHEIGVAIAVIRAYNAVLFRHQKLELLEQGIKVHEIQVDKIERLAAQKKMSITDLALARADLLSARARQGALRTVLSAARADLRRLLGTLDDSFLVYGELAVPLASKDHAALSQLAQELRPDLHARRAAMDEANAAVKLAVANRYGNPSVGPYFQYDPFSVSVIGARLSMPLAILNTHRAEIMRAQTEVLRARCEMQQLELRIAQDVQAALTRLADAEKWVRSYERDVLPSLTQTKLAMEKMFTNRSPDVDLPRFLAVQGAFVKAADGALDACFEFSQAEADLAEAVAEPALALGTTLSSPALNPPPAKSGR